MKLNNSKSVPVATIREYRIVQTEGTRSIVQDRLFESDFDRFVALQAKRTEIEAEEGTP